MYRKAAVLVVTAFLCFFGGCGGAPSTAMAPDVGCARKPTDATATAATHPPCDERSTQAPPPKEPNPPMLSEESFARFAPLFVAAFTNGDCERYCLSPDDVEKLFAPSVAPIIQSGRTGWVSALQERLADKLLRYKSVAKGPNYSFIPFQAASGNGENVPQVTDLRIEITANGNPLTIAVRKMYGVGDNWKILKAEVFE